VNEILRVEFSVTTLCASPYEINFLIHSPSLIVALFPRGSSAPVTIVQAPSWQILEAVRKLGLEDVVGKRSVAKTRADSTTMAWMRSCAFLCLIAM
jgi:hypothetical protein